MFSFLDKVFTYSYVITILLVLFNIFTILYHVITHNTHRRLRRIRTNYVSFSSDNLHIMYKILFGAICIYSAIIIFLYLTPYGKSERMNQEYYNFDYISLTIKLIPLCIAIIYSLTLDYLVNLKRLIIKNNESRKEQSKQNQLEKNENELIEFAKKEKENIEDEYNTLWDLLREKGYKFEEEPLTYEMNILSFSNEHVTKRFNYPIFEKECLNSWDLKHAKEDLEYIIELYNNVISKKPYEMIDNFKKSDKYLLTLADDYLSKEQQLEAADIYSKIENYKIKAAEIYSEINQEKKAIKIYTKLEEWKIAAELSEKIKSYKDAALYFEKANLIDLAIKNYKKIYKWEDVARLYSLNNDSESELESLVKAKQWNSAGKLAKKLNKLKEAERYFKNSNDYLELAEVLSLLKKHDEAGSAYIKCNDNENAIKEYMKSKNYSTIAQIYFDNKEYEKAAEYYIKCNKPIKAASSYEKANNFSKAALHYCEAGNLKNAADLYNKAKDLIKAAELYDELKDFNKSKEIWLREKKYDKYLNSCSKSSLDVNFLTIFDEINNDLLFKDDTIVCFTKEIALYYLSKKFDISKDNKIANKIFEALISLSNQDDLDLSYLIEIYVIKLSKINVLSKALNESIEILQEKGIDEDDEIEKMRLLQLVKLNSLNLCSFPMDPNISKNQQKFFRLYRNVAIDSIDNLDMVKYMMAFSIINENWDEFNLYKDIYDKLSDEKQFHILISNLFNELHREDAEKIELLNEYWTAVRRKLVLTENNITSFTDLLEYKDSLIEYSAEYMIYTYWLNIFTISQKQLNDFSTQLNSITTLINEILGDINNKSQEKDNLAIMFTNFWNTYSKTYMDELDREFQVNLLSNICSIVEESDSTLHTSIISLLDEVYSFEWGV